MMPLPPGYQGEPLPLRWLWNWMAKSSGRAWDSRLKSALVITYLFFGSYLLRSVDQTVHGGLEKVASLLLQITF